MNRIIGGNLLRTVFLLCVGTIVLTGCGSPGASSETVTFDSNGGSAVSSQSVESGKTATKPPDPTKDGFVIRD